MALLTKKKTLLLSVLSVLCVHSIPTAHASLLSVYESGKARSNQNLSIDSIEQLLQLQDKGKGQRQKALTAMMNQSRLESMKSYAYGVAVRTALIKQIGRINQEIKAQSRALDAIYNFEPLMLAGGRVVPPVLTEARNIYNQNTNRQIRLSGAVFDIYEQARFTSVAPNWREYLELPPIAESYETLALSTAGFEPKTDEEKQVWVKATEQGWHDGTHQANQLLQSAFDNLNRDYKGMVRFHQFVADGRITMPVINTYEMYDSNDGSRLVLDEQLLNIQTLPEFQVLPKGKAQPAETYLQKEPMPFAFEYASHHPIKALEDKNDDKQNKKLTNAVIEKTLTDTPVGDKPFDEPARIRSEQIRQSMTSYIKGEPLKAGITDSSTRTIVYLPKHPIPAPQAGQTNGGQAVTQTAPQKVVATPPATPPQIVAQNAPQAQVLIQNPPATTNNQVTFNPIVANEKIPTTAKFLNNASMVQDLAREQLNGGTPQATTPLAQSTQYHTATIETPPTAIVAKTPTTTQNLPVTPANDTNNSTQAGNTNEAVYGSAVQRAKAKRAEQKRLEQENQPSNQSVKLGPMPTKEDEIPVVEVMPPPRITFGEQTKSQQPSVVNHDKMAEHGPRLPNLVYTYMGK